MWVGCNILRHTRGRRLGLESRLAQGEMFVADLMLYTRDGGLCWWRYRRASGGARAGYRLKCAATRASATAGLNDDAPLPRRSTHSRTLRCRRRSEGVCLCA